jgi:hypothetical protein
MKSYIQFTHPHLRQIDGFDHLRFWLDTPELPFAKSLLQPHCTRVDSRAQQQRYQCHRKLELSLFQPTTKCLEILLEGVGHSVGIELVYAEIARDIVLGNPCDNADLYDAFLECARVPRLRHLVKFRSGTAYFGNRPKNHRGHVIALYCDKQSKLNNARPRQSAPPCVHVEWRAWGKSELAALGIAGLEDLIRFDHDRHWDTHLKLFNMPTKTALGKKLAALSGGKHDASNPAYLKRGDEFLGRYSLHGKFVLQNALREVPELARRLKTYTWNEWLSAYTGIELQPNTYHG